MGTCILIIPTNMKESGHGCSECEMLDCSLNRHERALVCVYAMFTEPFTQRLCCLHLRNRIKVCFA